MAGPQRVRPVDSAVLLRPGRCCVPVLWHRAKFGPPAVVAEGDDTGAGVGRARLHDVWDGIIVGERRPSYADGIKHKSLAGKATHPGEP